VRLDFTVSRLAGKKLSRGKRFSLFNPTVSDEEKELTVEPCGVAEADGDPVAVVDDDANVVVVVAAAVVDGGCVKG
jgi:hypothetical protein